jgi:hypothetical protein
MAAGLAASRDKWARRGALRGFGSIAIASTATNVLAKRLIRRVRPGCSSTGRRRAEADNLTAIRGTGIP